MKYTLKLIRMGLKNPRYYIESFNLKWRYLFVLTLIAVLMMTMGGFRYVRQPMDELIDNVASAEAYVPDFRFQGDRLQMADESQALYYQSDYFQLVIDPSLEANSQKTDIALNADQKARVNPETLISLFLVKNGAYLAVDGDFQPVENPEQVFANEDFLKIPMQTIRDRRGPLKNALFISLYLSQLIAYGIQMVIIALFAGLFNVRLKTRIPFRYHMKLAIVVSFVPIILIELANFLIPGLRLPFSIVVFISIFLIYLTYRNHIYFVQTIMRQMDLEEIKKYLPEDEESQDELKQLEKEKAKAQEDKSKDKSDEDQDT